MKFKKLEISEKVIQRLTEYLSILKDVQKYENEINSIELSKLKSEKIYQLLEILVCVEKDMIFLS